MNIRTKTLSIIIITFVVLAAALILASRIVVLGGFVKLEAKHARLNLQRVLNEISTAHSRYNSIAGDWAPWDDSYEFMENLNNAYIEDNLNDATLTNLGINFMIFLNEAGEPLFSKGIDLAGTEEAPLTDGLLKQITASDSLTKHAALNHSATGFLMNASMPVFVASRPILKSDFSGPSRGNLIVGRYFDTHEIERISGLTHLSLSMYPADDRQMPLDVRRAYRQLSQDDMVITPLDNEFIAGYALEKDVNGDPAFVLKVAMPRDIYLRGRETESYYIASLLLISVVFIGLTAILVDRIVLNPLSLLNQQVVDIGKTGDMSKRLSLSGSDELGSLSIEINRVLQQLQDARQRLQELVTQDGLTQLANRRKFDEHLDQEWRRSKREGLPLSLLICDIDYFKRYNDTYGHQAGDACLKQIARLMEGSVNRPADLVARYGGEEFAIILPNTDADGAHHIAQRIRSAVNAAQLPHSASLVSNYLSLSIGGATLIPDTLHSQEGLVKTADEALYQAKEKGRDRIVFPGYD